MRLFRGERLELGETNYVLRIGQPYDLKLERDGDRVKASLREKGTAGVYRITARDRRLEGGRLGFQLRRGRLEIQQIRVTGRVSEEWLRSAKEGE